MSAFRMYVSGALLALLPLIAHASDDGLDGFAPMDERESAQMAAQVKAEFQHAWSGYRQYAWGHDEVKPISKGVRDWYKTPLLMTPVDALDTMMLMGLDDEARDTRELIATRLDFDRDIYVKNFEITIRLLGGLLSAYEISHDERLLKLAEDLGKRLLPVFSDKTGLSFVEVNLKTGMVHNRDTNPAESGTLLLEFGTLSRLTGNPIYYDKAKRALQAIYERRSPIGLVGERLNTVTGRWTNRASHIGARIDSYYEYLWKCWLLFGDKDCKAMWDESIVAIDRYLADDVDGALWYGHADRITGKRTQPLYGALDAFMPGLLALSGDLDRAKRLQASGLRMWQLHGMEPEEIDYRRMKITDPGYALRPEIIESTFYLWRLTGDTRYRSMGKHFFEDFVKLCRTDVGYASISDIVKKKQVDRMHSFVMAETFKYYWLLFAPPDRLNLDEWVLNTEAHPLRRLDLAH